MNLWSHRFFQNMNEKLSGFLPCSVRAEVLTIFWEKRWLHKFILKFTDLYWLLSRRSSRYFFPLTDFLPCEFLLIQKLEIEKTMTTFIISVLKVGGVSFFKFQSSQGRKSVREKSTFFSKFSFSVCTKKLHNNSFFSLNIG